MLKDYRRMLSGLMAAVLVMSQSFGVFAAESVDQVSAPDDASESTVQAVSSEELTGSLEAYGFPGGYDLDEEDMEFKLEMKENDMASTLAACSEGVDYEAGKIWFPADTREEADEIAAAYNAKVVWYSDGAATASLSGGRTVLDAVRAACDTGVALPPVEPVYCWGTDPVTLDDEDDDGADPADSLDSAGAIKVDSAFTWKDFLYGNYDSEDGLEAADPILDHPDQFLQRPSVHDATLYMYQYQHDLVNSWGAWGTTIGSASVKVALIDSGVYADHDDFKDPQTGECYIKKTKDIVQKTLSENQLVERNLPFHSVHGTHVAGIITAAINNDIGGAGIAPGVTILSYNVENDEDSMYSADIYRAINEAVADEAAIINMSVAGPEYSAFVRAALQTAHEKGVCVFASTGNFSTNEMYFPAGYATVKKTGVVAVGAVGDRELAQ